MSVTASGVYEWYEVWINTSCFSDPDGDSFTIYANQPNYGTIGSYSGCASGRTCWTYYPYSGWDGTPYQASFTIYATDEHGAKSSSMTMTLRVNG